MLITYRKGIQLGRILDTVAARCSHVLHLNMKKESRLLQIVRKSYPILAFVVVVTTMLTHYFLQPQWTTDLFSPSYPIEKKDGNLVYGKGAQDVNLVVFLILSLLVVRHFITEFVFSPLSKLIGTPNKKRNSFNDMGECSPMIISTLRRLLLLLVSNLYTCSSSFCFEYFLPYYISCFLFLYPYLYTDRMAICLVLIFVVLLDMVCLHGDTV